MKAVDSVLLSKNALEGPHRVKATLRPLRVAFLVSATDPSQALAAVSSCTVLWGGMMYLIIPCQPGGEPEGIWSFLLALYDPDEVVDMVGAAKQFVERQHED